MDAQREQLLRDAVGQTTDDLVPVARWGGILSPGAQKFFASGYSDGKITDDTEGYFLEAFRISDPINLKAALTTVHSVVRGQSRYYEALITERNVERLFALLGAHNACTADKAAFLLSGLVCRYPHRFVDAHLHQIANYPGSEYGKLDVRTNLLKYDGYRVAVWNNSEGRIVAGLKDITCVPMLYKALMAVWLCSFNKDLIRNILPVEIIDKINVVLSQSRTEKIIRMALQAVQNLLKSKAMCEHMAETGTVDLVSALEYEKWRDPELVENIKQLIQDLNQEVKLLTNFERFEREVKSGALKWGFIHSERFWLENVLKCEGHNFRIIDWLMAIVRNSKSSVESLAVACHDIGEFSRLHPIGKNIACARGAKDRMLELMSDENREVAREALLCVQKLMLQKPIEVTVAV